MTGGRASVDVAPPSVEPERVAPSIAPSTLSQTIATVPGITYDFQFYLSLQNAVAGTSDAFSATFGNATVTSLTNALSNLYVYGAQSYVLYDYTVVATGPSTTPRPP